MDTNEHARYPAGGVEDKVALEIKSVENNCL